MHWRVIMNELGESDVYFDPIFRGLIFGSSCWGGGTFCSHRKPTSALNSLTKSGTCVGLCMNFKFQF